MTSIWVNIKICVPNNYYISCFFIIYLLPAFDQFLCVFIGGLLSTSPLGSTKDPGVAMYHRLCDQFRDLKIDYNDLVLSDFSTS